MKKGGSAARDADKLGWIATFFAPALCLVQTWVIAEWMYGFTPINVGWAILLIGFWLLVVLLQTLPRSYSRTQLAAFHLFDLFILLVLGSFVLGFTPLVVVAWAFISLQVFASYGIRAFYVSLTVMFIGICLQISTNDYPLDAVITIMFTGAAVALFAALIVPRLEPKNKKTVEPEQNSDNERILTIINNLADPVLSTDKNGTLTLYNAAALNLLDTNTGITNQKINDVLKVQDEDAKPVDVLALLKKSKGVVVNDSLRMDIGDETLRLEVTYAPIRSSYSTQDTSGSGYGYVIIARDVTRLKSLEEERDEFISVVSHELRTPITIAEGTISNAQLMMERGLNDASKVTDSLHEAHEQVLFLAKMINDLSTLSRAERGVASEQEMIDVTQLAHDLYNEYSPEAEKRSLQLNLELGSRLGYVKTSRLYLHELLQNFITNGIKYTQKGQVTLEIVRKKDLVTFTVHDSGIGISKSDQAKIFKKFYRSEDYRTRETGGTGLGLYVAAKLAKKMQTSIDVSSRLNHGSTFSFSLPSAGGEEKATR
jgi:signal transduction histidine kinase